MTADLHPELNEKAGAREWIGLAVLALPTLLVSVDVSVLLLALPHLAVALKADSAQMLWIMDIYGFMLAGFLITMGTLGDRIGRRKILMIGAAAFTAASVSGMAIGPLIGGFMLEHFWWGSVFLLGVPVMVLLLVAAPILLPEYLDEQAGRIDLISVALSLLTILPAIYGLKEIAKHEPDAIALAVELPLFDRTVSY